MNKKIVKFNNIYEGEHTISNLIKTDNNCSAHFKYSHHPPNGYELVVITYNPKHKISFFLHSLYGKTKENALENMYDHICNFKNNLNKKESQYFNYTIEWYNFEEKRVKSIFYGKSIQDVIGKFFYGKHGKESNINIYSITLIPN
jgi:hypothetical protein